MEYIPVKSLEAIDSTFRQKTLLSSGNDFVETIMFGKDEGVVMVGNMVNSAEPGKVLFKNH
jgi:hypothetical protein